LSFRAGSSKPGRRDAGLGTGILCFIFMLFLPIPGVVGWFIGRGIAWMRY
jgi:hypothetical protein